MRGANIENVHLYSAHQTEAVCVCVCVDDRDIKKQLKVWSEASVRLSAVQSDAAEQ